MIKVVYSKDQLTNTSSFQQIIFFDIFSNIVNKEEQFLKIKM